MAGLLLVNPRSGDDRPSAEDLRDEAERHGIEVRLLAEDDDAVELARKADADALGMAGGDGSLAPVAAVAIERELPFVVVPFGTRNHFARDVGLDRDDPVRALDAFLKARERHVDVGRVNGDLFLNNVSLGLYADLVHRRESHRRRGEALARLRALVLLARDRSTLGITVDGQPVETHVALIANNDYQLDLFSLGERQGLDGGRLHLHIAHGLLPGSWQERAGDRFVIDSIRGRLHAARDGEPAELDTPLEFTIEPRALRVLLPPGS
ncbi:MAG TPA: diacylglycerol kinase family protein [Gaiellaceae bacterium]|nr:diacylglycerol kinase family protein [Gaiellaceae bacterium]